MLNPKSLNFVMWVFVKYLIFYAFVAIKNNNYYFLRVNELKNGQDLFYYLWMLLFLPGIYCIVFLPPLYFTFKTKKPVRFTLLLIAIFSAEYFLYTYLASPSDFKNGIYLVVIGLLLLLVFFHKSISSIFRESIQNRNATP